MLINSAYIKGHVIWQDVILSCFNYISLSEIDNAVRRCQLVYIPYYINTLNVHFSHFKLQQYAIENIPTTKSSKQLADNYHIRI